MSSALPSTASSSSSSTSIRFDNQVAIVTGSGGGLGRIYAIDLAKRGAKVVINDVGTIPSPRDPNVRISAADAVVDEIKAFGGIAIADKHSVEEGEAIVQNTIHHFGPAIHILINNAGILRDISFLKITSKEWNAVLNVHLRGTFKVTRAVWPYMVKQQYGRIVMVSSAAGIYGNVGQANYSAAKLALVGLANVLSMEGGKKGIQVNTIAPIAASAMTASILPPDLLETLKPEYVSPAVLYLCSKQCTENGGLYELGAGWISKLRWERSESKFIPPVSTSSTSSSNETLTLETVEKYWNEINNFDPPSGHPTTNQDAFTTIMALWTNLNNKV